MLSIDRYHNYLLCCNSLIGFYIHHFNGLGDYIDYRGYSPIYLMTLPWSDWKDWKVASAMEAENPLRIGSKRSLILPPTTG